MHRFACIQVPKINIIPLAKDASRILRCPGFSHIHIGNTAKVCSYMLFDSYNPPEERTQKCIPGFILILTDTKSELFMADEAAYDNHLDF